MEDYHTLSLSKVTQLSLLSAIGIVIRQLFIMIPTPIPFQFVSGYLLAVAVCIGLADSLLVSTIMFLLTSFINGIGIWTFVQIILYVIALIIWNFIYPHKLARIVYLILFAFVYGIISSLLLLPFSTGFTMQSILGLAGIIGSIPHCIGTIIGFPLFYFIFEKTKQSGYKENNY